MSENLERVTQLLTAARGLIDTPAKWTKGTNARNLWGDSVSPYLYEATCFCSLGALSKASQRPPLDSPLVSKNRQEAVLYLTKAIHSITGRDEGVSIASFNDSSTHEEVMAAFDNAIELSKSAVLP
jgi:hypothetical protein